VPSNGDKYPVGDAPLMDESDGLNQRNAVNTSAIATVDKIYFEGLKNHVQDILNGILGPTADRSAQ
jgi:hypothetical protein